MDLEGVKFYSMVFALLVSLQFTFAYEKIDTDKWSVPTFVATLAMVDSSTLYLVDSGDWKVKVYDISKGLSNPKFLWATPGKGQGPGELNSPRINSLAVDPETGNLWISHWYGIQVFSHTGAFIEQIRLTTNRAALTIGPNSLFLTSFDLLKDRVLLQSLQKNLEHDFENPIWEAPHPHGIPAFENGVWIEESQELCTHEGHFYVWDFVLGELAIVDSNGKIGFFSHPLHLRIFNDFIPDHYEEPKVANQTRICPTQNAKSGIVVNDYIWTLVWGPKTAKEITVNTGQKVQFLEQVLVKIDKKGEVLSYYRHKVLLQNKKQFLFDMNDNVFCFLDTLEGNYINLISITEMEKISNFP